MESFGPLVAASWLAENLTAPDLRVIDFRWYLDGRSGLEAYGSGHIPGAVFLDLEAVTGSGLGRHPLPTRPQFEEAIRAAGVDTGDRVIVYDDQSGSVAARLWWLLRWFGHQTVAVLDGGIQAWGEPLETTTCEPEPGDFVAAEPDQGWVAAREEVAGRDPRTVLIDARAPERYSGDSEPVDPVAGHIPGALNVFWKDTIGRDGRLLSPERLRERFAESGISAGQRVIAYCGSGVTACSDLLALEVAGLSPALLYAGSWSEWVAHKDPPVATGEQP